MATTGTTDFELDVVDLVEEAYERCGVEMRTGHHMITARRSLNLLLIEWQNRGLNLWTIDQQSLTLTASSASYSLSSATVDVLDHVLRTGTGSTQRDVPLKRVSMSDYSAIPNKNIEGTPRLVYVDRTLTPGITLWPVPDDTETYTFVYWRMRRIEDAGSGAHTQDVPYRFLPVLSAGLAYYLRMKQPQSSVPLADLKVIYDEQWGMAAGEDRDRSDFKVRPRVQ